MKDMKTEELKKMYQDLGAELERREQEEKDKLKAEKDARYKEVIDAYENFEKLRSKYIEDYSYFTFDNDGITFSLGDFFFKMR